MKPSAIDPHLLDRLIAPVDGAGLESRNFEYHPDSVELDFLLARASHVGECPFDTGPPLDWLRVRSLAEGLLLQSKDLRLAVKWTRAAAHTVGLGGLAAGLRLCVSLIECFGPQLHPRVDPDDGERWVRRSAALGLVDPSWLAELRRLPLDAAAGITLRSVELAARSDMPTASEAGQEPDEIYGRLRQVFPLAHEDLPTWRALHARVERFSQLAQAEFGVHPDDLDPLRKITSSIDHMARALLAGVEVLGDAPFRGRPRIESMMEASSEIERVREFLARVDAMNPAALLLERSIRLLARRAVP